MDFKELKKAIKSLTPSKLEIADALLSKAEFMESELNKLQEILKEKGWTEVYTNGATQCGIKKSSEADVYNTMIKNYNSTLKILNDMVPEGTDEKNPEEEFFK